MYCDCIKKHPGVIRAMFFGGMLSASLMVVGIPVFRPKMVLFPLPWILGILTLLLTVTLPLYIIRKELKK